MHLVSLLERAFFSVFCFWLNGVDVHVRDVYGEVSARDSLGL